MRTVMLTDEERLAVQAARDDVKKRRAETTGPGLLIVGIVTSAFSNLGRWATVLDRCYTEEEGRVLLRVSTRPTDVLHKEAAFLIDGRSGDILETL